MDRILPIAGQQQCSVGHAIHSSGWKDLNIPKKEQVTNHMLCQLTEYNHTGTT